jgi:hypothetical protein
MSAPPRVLGQVFGYAIIILIAFGGFGYSLKKWHSETRKRELSTWRRMAANLGFLVVALQAALLLAALTWPRISRNHDVFGQWVNGVLVAFFLGVPLVLAGKWSSRWWLLSSSIIIFAICYLIALTP